MRYLDKAAVENTPLAQRFLGTGGGETLTSVN